MSSPILSAFYAEARRGSSKDPIMYMEVPGTLQVGTDGAARFAHVAAIDRDKQTINRNTWDVVQREFLRVFGLARLNRVSARYGINFEDMKNSGREFLAKHVEMIGVGSADLRTSDIKVLPQEKLKYLSSGEIWRRIQMACPEPYLGTDASVSYIHAGRNNGGFKISHDLFLQDKERLHLGKTMQQIYSPRVFFERLSKTLASKEMDEKTIIPAPTYDGFVDYYKVYKKIADGNGLVAYALKPISMYSRLDPIIMFRSTPLNPTAIDAIETWRNDFYHNVGSIGYESAKFALQNLMNDPKFSSGKKVVCGFSLGGTHAQFFIKDHWTKCKEGYFFNDPSIDSVSADSFAAELNHQPFFWGQNPDLRLHIFRTKGDVIHLAGSKHLGFGIQTPKVKVVLTEIAPIENVQLGYVSLHTRRLFDNPEVLYTERVIEGEELKKELHNSLRGRFAIWFERIRRLIGGYVVAPILVFFFWIIQKIAGLFGYQVLRNSRIDGDSSV